MSGAQSISTRRRMVCSASAACGHGRGRVSMRGGRHRGTARAGIAAGPSARPRTMSWWATSAGCSKRRPFHGEGYRKVWAKLRVEGIRTSPERVRRLMRAHDLQAPHRVGQAHGPTVHNGTITTETPDVMWGTDMTATVTVGEGAACVFVAVDHCTTECIGLHAAKSGNRLRGPGAHPPGCPRTLRRDQRRPPPAGCGCVTTTGRTTWPPISNRRSRSSGLRVPRALCERPKVTAWRSASSAR